MRARRHRWAVTAGLMLWPLGVWAWPVDVMLDVEAGSEKFQRPTAIEWVDVDDPKVATAEVLESGEVLVSGLTAGQTLVLLYAEGKMAVWRVRVSGKGERPRPVRVDEALAPAKKACPGLALQPGDPAPTLTVTVKDEKCRAALLELFRTDALHARQLDLTFELAALQAQLASIEAGLKALPGAHPQVTYRGAGLSLEGTLDEAEHRRALWEIFRRSAGRVALDDQTSVSAPKDSK